MKKIGKGLVAVVFAVASVAFTTGAKTDDFDCSGNLLWYLVKVNNGDDITVSVGSPIDAVDLTFLDLDNIPDQAPSGVTSADFAAHLRSQSSAQSFFCPTTGPFVCAIGFKPDATPSGEFKLVSISGTIYIIPKTSSEPGTPPTVECIIFRNFTF